MLAENAANIKRLAVAGKPLAWCIDAGIVKPFGDRIARFNTAGWLPLQYAQALGVGGRNGVEILPGVVMQANHLGYTAGQVYYSLDAAGKLMARTMIRGVKLPSYDISIAVLDGVSVRHAPLAPEGFALPMGTPVVMNDAGDSIKNAIICRIGTYAAPFYKYGADTAYSSFYIAANTTGIGPLDSSGGVILLTDAGPVAVGARQRDTSFVNCCDAAVRKEIDAALQQLGVSPIPPAVITPQQVADACNAAGLNTVEKLTAALRKVAI